MALSSTSREINSYEQFRNALEENHAAALNLIQKLDLLGNDNSQWINEVEEEKSRLFKSISIMNEELRDIHGVFYQEIERRCRRYRNIIEKLRRSISSVASEKYLLEFKRRDLLQLTSELEEAYDEISNKNRELLEQKQFITEQTEELKAAQEKILEANNVLEQQKESLLDQADYLHEANEAVIQMHEEVQKQKEEILQKNEELLTLNLEKNNLIGIVAHDLKSPLNQMKGLLSLIKLTSEHKLDEETRNFFGMIEASVGNMSAMILKILDVEAIEAKSLNLAIEKLKCHNY